MDTYNWVSGTGVFLGSCVLSGGLLSVRRKHVLYIKSLELNEAHRLFLTTNLIRIQTVILRMIIHLVTHDSTPPCDSLSPPNPQRYANLCQGVNQ
jgi:lysylphosphatidylglycerol synthetase-like protein (DUF2156 family)